MQDCTVFGVLEHLLRRTAPAITAYTVVYIDLHQIERLFVLKDGRVLFSLPACFFCPYPKRTHILRLLDDFDAKGYKACSLLSLGFAGFDRGKLLIARRTSPRTMVQMRRLDCTPAGLSHDS